MPDKRDNIKTFLENHLTTEFVGRQLYQYSTVTTTMDVAKKLAREGAVEGTVIIADKQTSGKGRLSRVWLSPEGNLAMSIILRPSMENLPQLAWYHGIPARQTGVERTKRRGVMPSLPHTRHDSPLPSHGMSGFAPSQQKKAGPSRPYGPRNHERKKRAGLCGGPAGIVADWIWRANLQRLRGLAPSVRARSSAIGVERILPLVLNVSNALEKSSVAGSSQSSSEYGLPGPR